MAGKGRPSSYTQATADEICRRLAEGESLRQIIAAASMPDQRTVYRWLESNADFRQQYVHARELQAEFYADEIVRIADECMIGTKTTKRANGDTEIVTGDMVDRSRLRVEARKWIASKLLPKKYGDKLELDGKLDGGFALIVNSLPK